MHHVYIDNEFDAVRIDGRNMQQVIALGAVICDARYQEVGRFYSLVRPMGFQRLSYHVRRMTHLHDHDIRRASAFPQVMDTFIALLREYDPLDQIKIYSFGPDDGRTLCANAGAYHHESEQLFARIIDLQSLMSSRVTYQGEVFHKAFSLEALKLVYHVRGEVNHNALSDAVDLYRVHEAYRQERELDEEQVSALYAVMMQRRAQGERKRRENQARRVAAMVEGIAESFTDASIHSAQDWQCFHAQLLELGEKHQFAVLRALRRLISMPEHTSAWILRHSERVCCWLRFDYPDMQLRFCLPLYYGNADEMRRFLNRWIRQK